jgi:hypothetical protein
MPNERATPSPPRDRTPNAGAPRRGQPAKGMAHNSTPSLAVIGGLLLLATIVALLLWTSVQFGTDDGDSSAPSTVLPPGAAPGQDPAAADTAASNGATPDAPGLPAGPAATATDIASVVAYDPDGDDGGENSDEAVLALADGDTSTFWRTSCYDGEFMGGKFGVGLVLNFDTPVQRAVTVGALTAPYIIEFYTSANDSVPASFDGWDGQLGSREFDTEPGTVISAVPDAAVRHVLVVLRQLGEDDNCSDARPFRGRLGEIALV